MTNQDQPDLPKNEGDAGSEELAELDVDALLDQASSLADELSGEVGESADDPDGSVDDNDAADDAIEGTDSAQVDASAVEEPAEVGIDDLPVDTDQVEAKLDSLQSAVDALDAEMSEPSKLEESQAEIGDLASPDEGDAGPSDPGSDATGATGGDDSAADPPPPSELDLAAAASDLGLDTTAPAEPVGESPGIPELSAEELAFDPPPGSQSLDESGDDAPKEPGGRLTGRLAPLLPVLKKAEPLALRVAAIGAFVLEKVDRPFGMIGNGIRSILGLLAIATMATAIVVLAVSFL